MPIKLTKNQAAHWSAMLDAARDKMTEANQAITEFNSAMAEHQRRVEDAVAAYNEAMDNLRTDADDFVVVWQGEWADRSERWRESEAGLAATDFIETWQSWDPENVDIAYPDPIDEIEEDAILAASELPQNLE